MRAQKTLERRHNLELIFRENLNQRLSYTWLLKQLADSELSPRSLQHLCNQWRKDFARGYAISVGRNEVIVTESSQSILGERKEKFPEIKRALGAALWDYLFNPAAKEEARRPVYDLRGYTEVIDQKRNAVQNKSNLILNIDAGTTTEAAMIELLALDSFPIPVRVPLHEGDKKLLGRRFLSPTIFTNSLSIAGAIARRVEAQRLHDLELFLVGGLFRPERGSIVGERSQSCLRAWSTQADVAVIGTTGYRPDHTGCPAFACDNLAESHSKQTLLASAWCRILILVSDKLTAKTVSSVFVPLAHPALDLIVIDDGLMTRRKNGKQDVKDLCDKATKARVACLVVSKATHGSGSQSAPKSGGA
jgi:hypothetical protein